jgi:succinate dehydrogenase / fumarate reductase, flavoprotein subunit
MRAGKLDGKARGVVIRDLVTGEIKTYAGHAVLLCTGGYGNVFFHSTNAKGCNVTATWRAYKRGAGFANPCYTQIHPTCIPVSGEYQSKLTLMSESLRNDGRVWVPNAGVAPGTPPNQIRKEDRDYFLERRYPAFGNLVPRDVASRAAKAVCDEGRGVGEAVNGERRSVYLDFADAIARLGEAGVREKYGNLFHMYEKITGENPYQVPMRIYPAVHYTMGGLWVDYNLMSNVPGLHVLGEANFSDHGANRLGASALMQGLADGYFVIPYTLGHYLASTKLDKVGTDHPAFVQTRQEVQGRVDKLLALTKNEPKGADKARRSVDSFHMRLGKIMWDRCGMARNAAGLKTAMGEIAALREEFWSGAWIPPNTDMSPPLEKAGRVADFLEFGELMCKDALDRDESCGGHFREEHQTEEGETQRDDERFAHVSVWEHQGDGKAPLKNAEPLTFETVKLTQRSYK